MDKVDCVVIGAGVIGLAVARQLALSGREVLILEREHQFGSITSSRNSEVIHAGIYYPEGSLKADLCVRGRQALYQYCDEFAIPHRRCGKLIVATGESQLIELENIRRRALANGVNDLRFLDKAEAKKLEPALRSYGALLSPSTGIIDSHAYMLSLLAQAEASGALISYRTSVEKLECNNDSITVFIQGESKPVIKARWLINAAGLDAPKLAAATSGLAAEYQPKAYLAKGDYFTLKSKAPFSHLIYPLPEPGGLGIHLTLDLAGQARFGPDVEWIKNASYKIAPQKRRRFYEAIRQYWPELREESLEPGYAGLRPKISAPGSPAADFRIDGPEVHGVNGLINLFGFESPGLTASLAIGEDTKAAVEQQSY